MITINGRHHLASSPEAVFEAGRHTTTWPEDIDGLNVRPHDNKLDLGSRVSVAVDLHGINLGLQAEVREFIVAKSIVIEGKSNLAKFSLYLALAEHEEGTNVDHLLEISKRSKLIPLPLGEPVIKSLVEPRAFDFANKYCKNVGNHIKNGVALA